MSKVVSRDRTIDGLRILGVALVFLAHTGIPGIAQNIRCFDVVLLCVASGMSIQLSTQKAKTKYGIILKKRFFKLIIPAWIGMSLVLVLRYIVSLQYPHIDMYNLKYIPFIYAFVVDIGYFWISRVYFVIALVSPAFIWLINRKNGVIYGIAASILLLFINQMLIDSKIINNYYLITFITESLCYIAIAMTGYVIQKSDKALGILTCISLAGSALMFLISGRFEPNMHKEPPDIVYVAYGLSVSLTLIEVSKWIKRIGKRPLRNHGVIEWLSRHSYTLYISHTIPAVAFLWIRESGLVVDWRIEYLFLCIFALGATSLSTKLMGKYRKAKIR